MIISYVDLSEKPTDSELVARNEYLDAQVAAGTTNGMVASTPDTLAGIRAWTTNEAANAYVDWCNTLFTSRVVKAIVTTVE